MLIEERNHIEDNSFVMFDDAIWPKDVKIIECGNEKSLEFFKSCIRDIGELLANTTIEDILLYEVNFSRIVTDYVG